MSIRITPKPAVKRFHQAQWDEPIIFELSQPGQRGVLLPAVEPGIQDEVGDVAAALPAPLRRTTPPALPEMSQNLVLRHYDRLSQENLGVDLNVDIGQGTCTMKYSPKVNDQLARSPKMSELHPLQDESTVQGMLEIMYRTEQMLKEISGLDRFTLQPGAGSSAIYANVAMIRAYHAARGDTARDEVITTIFSHPSNAACAKTAGYKIITLYPNENGYPDLEALKAAVSERTAALMITNPEDTGIYNPRIAEFVDLVHAAGGLCSYDQANLNGLLGIARAREAGFDLCHFNLHKTFSTPHGCGGPGAGASGVTEALAPFLPTPTVEFDGQKYYSRFRPPAQRRQDPPLVWRGAKHPQSLRLDHEPGRRRAAPGLRDRRFEQQLPAEPGFEDPRCEHVLCERGRRHQGKAHRAGALQLGAADRRNRRPFGRDRPAHRRLRHALLDLAPPLRRPGADDPGADRVLFESRHGRIRSHVETHRGRGLRRSGASSTPPRTTAPST